MILIIIKLFLVAFFINLLYEMLHSLLYKTCYEAGLKKYVYLMIKGASFDGFWISFIYLITYFAFNSINIFSNYYQLSLFLIISLLFAYIWEIYAVKNKRWEYADKMPIALGVGLTPLIQLAITGLISTYFTLNIY